MNACPSCKKRYSAKVALVVALEIFNRVSEHVSRFDVAGSLRREKAMVGDIEIVYIPIFGMAKADDFFQAPVPVNLTDRALDNLIKTGVISKRLNKNGQECWGEMNKLAVHVQSGIPIDLFTASEDTWFNYLVCRTGGTETNKRICMAAQRKGCKWNPYGVGFTDQEGNIVPVDSEESVFRLAGLPYLQPWERP